MAWVPVSPKLAPEGEIPDWAEEKLTKEEMVQLRMCLMARFDSGYNYAIARMENGEF